MKSSREALLSASNRVNAVAPIRICDIGGWTDTWFAVHGAVFNMAVYPYVEVQVLPIHRETGGPRIRINVENFGEAYDVDPARLVYDKHPLLEAGLDVMQLPADLSLEINIYSDAPPGASTGTSAAVSVALIGALDSLTQGRLTPHQVAARAHSIETEKLGLQSGIQDQIASAYGGLNFIQMYEYPRASVSSLQLPNPLWWELENRLAVVYIGAPHNSSEIHRRVIARMDSDASDHPVLEALRKLAHRAKDAVYSGNFADLGNVMDANTELQRQLHPGLVCEKFEQIIATAREFSCLGCKVNGAGGDGGSLTILGNGDMAMKRRMLRTIAQQGYSVLPIYLSRQGLRVW